MGAAFDLFNFLVVDQGQVAGGAGVEVLDVNWFGTGQKCGQEEVRADRVGILEEVVFPGVGGDGVEHFAATGNWLADDDLHRGCQEMEAVRVDADGVCEGGGHFVLF